MRSKLFLLSVVLVAVGLVAAEVILVPRLERTQIVSTKIELGRLARAAGDARVRRLPGEDAHDVATRLGRLMGVRVTFIDGTGRVVGDSQLARESLAGVENHGDRPEIAAARPQVLRVRTMPSEEVSALVDHAMRDAGAQTFAILVGYFSTHFPSFLEFESGAELTVYEAAAPAVTVFWLNLGLIVVLALVLPLMGYLYKVFQAPGGASGP